MDAVQIVAASVSAGVTLVAVTLFVRAVVAIVRTIRLGAPDPTRGDAKVRRLLTTLTETVGHTRMLRWTVVGAAHWFVFVAFGALLFTLVEAYGEVVDPTFTLPLLGNWTPYALATELIAALGGLGILVLIAVRLLNEPRRAPGRTSRFAGSTMWQGYYVELTILAVIACVFAIRGTRVALGEFHHPVWATPVSHALGAVLPARPDAVSVLALVKILVSMAWFVVIARNLTMGVAWHRFSVFFNVFFKRHADGKVSLGALPPMMSNGHPLDFEQADPETDTFGAGQVEHFTWKGLLDFSTCTECGRCQSQCPAWNTAKPLSPKLLVLGLRDHAYAKAPYLAAGGGRDATGDERATPEQLAGVPAAALAEADRPLVGDAAAGGVIDPDVLWSCTTCGACVEQCPVDIEHVDHIVDMRRHQVMIESSFPSEAGVMLRNLENQGNPWGANPNTREDWLRGLDFEVRRVEPGGGLPDEVEYLFWVGCAGALDDRAKKVTVAVATLLHQAGVEFAVLGNAETCTGDPARRIGNEFLFETLARQNVETLDATFAGREPARRTIVSTCAHCFNTLSNEYPQLGGEYQVVHHTELLARLVAEGRLTPVTPVDATVTFHDPCYLGRHNRVFSPPREVLDSVPGARVTEMPRFAERSFCCGAGGARMWMEERIGKRINVERTEEALATGADIVAIGCPFCLTMLSDGVTGAKASGDAADSVEVLDVSQVLLRTMTP